MNKKGMLSIITLLSVSVLLSVGVFIASVCRNGMSYNNSKRVQLAVFYLAEGGLESAKSKLNDDPLWSTDAPHADYDKRWLLASAKGEVVLYGGGGYKMVKENGKPAVYSIGFLGPEILKSPAFSFQRIDIEFPIRQVKWEVF